MNIVNLIGRLTAGPVAATANGTQVGKMRLAVQRPAQGRRGQGRRLRRHNRLRPPGGDCGKYLPRAARSPSPATCTTASGTPRTAAARSSRSSPTTSSSSTASPATTRKPNPRRRAR